MLRRTLAVVGVGLLLLALPAFALAAEATPGASVGDPRSPGEGPGFAGDPAFAIGAALAVGLAAAAGTWLYVRLTAARHRD